MSFDRIDRQFKPAKRIELECEFCGSVKEVAAHFGAENAPITLCVDCAWKLNADPA